MAYSSMIANISRIFASGERKLPQMIWLRMGMKAMQQTSMMDIPTAKPVRNGLMRMFKPLYVLFTG
jgi:hypothetical protein